MFTLMSFASPLLLRLRCVTLASIRCACVTDVVVTRSLSLTSVPSSDDEEKVEASLMNQICHCTVGVILCNCYVRTSCVTCHNVSI